MALSMWNCLRKSSEPWHCQWKFTETSLSCQMSPFKMSPLSPRAMTGKKKVYTTNVETPLFLLFPGLRLYGVYPSFRTYGVYPFPLFSQEKGIHHSLFCSVTSGSGDRPRKEGSRGGGVYSFFPRMRATRGERP